MHDFHVDTSQVWNYWSKSIVSILYEGTYMAKWVTTVICFRVSNPSPTSVSFLFNVSMLQTTPMVCVQENGRSTRLKTQGLRLPYYFSVQSKSTDRFLLQKKWLKLQTSFVSLLCKAKLGSSAESEKDHSPLAGWCDGFDFWLWGSVLLCKDTCTGRRERSCKHVVTMVRTSCYDDLLLWPWFSIADIPS